MSRFFRRIRQKLLSENKFSKYLIYASGEIILVVIGILLALYINNQNQLSTNRQRVDILLEKILHDLEELIKSSHKQQRWYAEEENLLTLISQEKLTYEDYASQKYFKMFLLTYENRFVGFKRRIGYDNLFLELDHIPAEYDSLLAGLNLIYHVSNMRELHEARVKEITKANRRRWREFQWFGSNLPNHQNEEMIDFLLHDYRYKNEAKEYSYEILLHKRFIKDEKNNAKKSYKDISAILGKPLDSLVLGYNTNVYEILIGKWRTKSYPAYGISFFKEGNILKFTDTQDKTGELEFIGDRWFYEDVYETEYNIFQEDSIYKLKTVGEIIWEKV